MIRSKHPYVVSTCVAGLVLLAVYLGQTYVNHELELAKITADRLQRYSDLGRRSRLNDARAMGMVLVLYENGLLPTFAQQMAEEIVAEYNSIGEDFRILDRTKPK